MQGQQPLVEVTRGGWVESVHAGHAVLIDPEGTVISSWGLPSDPIMPRSAVKPLQVVGMLDAGLELDEEAVALASASHSGESIHVEGVRKMLADAGLTDSDLRNAPGWPYSPAAERAWLEAGRGPSPLVANCSGKHAAMLRTALALGAPLAGYLGIHHPVQQAAIAGIERLVAEPHAAVAVDGCGAPAVAISLVGLARSFSALVQSPAGSNEARVARAMSARPELVGGSDRDVTVFMRSLPGAIAKDGAEGVHVLALPDGHAAAVKIADGSDRARVAVASALLAKLGIDSAEVLRAVAPKPVQGGGRAVGRVRAII